MKLMKLYHLSLENFGEEVDLIPRVPAHPMQSENKDIERVCCSTSIPGCIRSIFMIARIRSYNETWYERLCKGEDHVKFYIYSLDVPVQDIIQPRKSQLPDQFITNEFWVTEAYTWPLLDAFYIKKGADISDFYSVWKIQRGLDARGPDWSKLPSNRGFESISGDFDNFNFIEVNPYLFDKLYYKGEKESKDEIEKKNIAIMNKLLNS